MATAITQRQSRFYVLSMRMVVCPECGNKRCPKASDHNNACTGSNEPGQAGSIYGDAHMPKKLTLHHDGQEEMLDVVLDEETIVSVNYDSHGSSALSLVGETARKLAEAAGWEVEDIYPDDEEDEDLPV